MPVALVDLSKKTHPVNKPPPFKSDYHCNHTIDAVPLTSVYVCVLMSTYESLYTVRKIEDTVHSEVH